MPNLDGTGPSKIGQGKRNRRNVKEKFPLGTIVMGCADSNDELSLLEEEKKILELKLHEINQRILEHKK